MGYLMGIDLGTSSLKVMIVDEAGRTQALCAQSYQYDAPSPGYAQQDPEVWWRACCTCVNQALQASGLPAASIQAVCFSGQMHGLVLVDAQGKSVRPAILHCDCRSTAQVEEIRQKLSPDYLETKLLNQVYTGFLLPSLLWVRQEEPENFAKIHRICLPKDYIKYKLTGAWSTDYSDASGTLLYEVAENRWAAQVLTTFDLSADWLVPLLGAADRAGVVQPAAALQTGLAPGTLVAAGGGDTIMQGLGNGSAHPDQVILNIGSSGQVCLQSTTPLANPRLTTNIFSSYRRDQWLVLGAIMHGGLALQWLRQMFGGMAYGDITRLAQSAAPGSGGVLFLPFLGGARTPFMNPDFTGGFLGCTLQTTQAQLARAVLEGVVFALYQCMETCRDLGLSARRAVASGGGAKSPLWAQIQADVFGLPVHISQCEEQAALGAALAAGVCAGVYKDFEEACQKAVRYQPVVYQPDRKNHEIYQEYYNLYKELAQTNRFLLEKLSARNLPQGGRMENTP